MDRLKLTECLFNLICKEESIMATAAHLPASPPSFVAVAVHHRFRRLIDGDRRVWPKSTRVMQTVS